MKMAILIGTIRHKIGWYDYLMWYGNLNFLNGLGGTVIPYGTAIRYLRVTFLLFQKVINK